jgi:hypothetical protein
MNKHSLRFALSVTLGGMALLAAVKTDYSHSTDFGRYRTAPRFGDHLRRSKGGAL